MSYESRQEIAKTLAAEFKCGKTFEYKGNTWKIVKEGNVIVCNSDKELLFGGKTKRTLCSVCDFDLYVCQRELPWKGPGAVETQFFSICGGTRSFTNSYNYGGSRGAANPFKYADGRACIYLVSVAHNRQLLKNSEYLTTKWHEVESKANKGDDGFPIIAPNVFESECLKRFKEKENKGKKKQRKKERSESTGDDSNDDEDADGMMYKKTKSKKRKKANEDDEFIDNDENDFYSCCTPIQKRKKKPPAKARSINRIQSAPTKPRRKKSSRSAFAHQDDSDPSDDDGSEVQAYKEDCHNIFSSLRLGLFDPHAKSESEQSAESNNEDDEDDEHESDVEITEAKLSKQLFNKSSKAPRFTESMLCKPKVGEPECTCCYTYVADCAIVPCGHTVLCLKCANNDTFTKPDSKCPVCREEIDRIIRTISSEVVSDSSSSSSSSSSLPPTKQLKPPVRSELPSKKLQTSSSVDSLSSSSSLPSSSRSSSMPLVTSSFSVSKNGEYMAKIKMKYGGSIKSQSESSLWRERIIPTVYDFNTMLHYGKSVLSTDDIPLSQLFSSQFAILRGVVRVYNVTKLGKVLKTPRRKPPSDLKHIPISESDVFHVEAKTQKDTLRGYLLIIKNKDNKSFYIAGNSTRYMTQLFFIDNEKDYKAMISNKATPTKESVDASSSSSSALSSSTADPFALFDTPEEKPSDVLASYPVPLVSNEYLEENEYEADPE